MVRLNWPFGGSDYVNEGLRGRLEEITQDCVASSHPAHVADLQSEYPHSITVIESRVDIGIYTCGVHAFNLMGDPTYLAIAKPQSVPEDDIYPGAHFIEYILANHLMDGPTVGPSGVGDLVFYFNSGEFKHVGKVGANGRITSKWGEGCLWEHGPCEVPASYGTDVRYYAIPPHLSGLDLFRKYALSRGWGP